MAEQHAAAGWYKVSEGRLRYWNGEHWTDHFHDEPAGVPGQAARVGARGTGGLRGAASAAAASLTSDEQELPSGTLWAAVGKNLGKITTGRYRLDPTYLYYSKGALRTEWQQVYVASIVDVDVRQSMTQKTRGVYTVIVGLRDSPGFTMDDIPDGPTAQRVITQAGVDARLSLEQRSIRIEAQRHDATNTVRQEVRLDSNAGHVVLPQTIAGTVLPGSPSHGALPAASAGGDPQETPTDRDASAGAQAPPQDYIAQLRQLGELRDAGILTEEEFAAKKSEILDRI